MTIVDLSNAAADFDMLDREEIGRDTAIATTETDDTFSYTSLTGNIITLFAENDPVTGLEIGSIEIDLFGTESDVADIVITGVDSEAMLPFLLLIAFNASADELASFFWNTILDGEVELIAPTSDVDAAVYGNGLDFDEGVLVGEATTMTGIWNSSYVGGGVEDVSGTGTYIGGGLDFNGYMEDLTADADDVSGSAKIFGGDDHIVYTDITGADIGETEPRSVYVYADVYGLEDQSILIGGDDFVDMRALTFTSSVSVYGDTDDIDDATFVKGGDDTIYGATTVYNYLHGDIDDHFPNSEDESVTHSIVGGADIIYGGDAGNEIYGDWDDDLDAAEQGSVGGNDTLYGGAGNDLIYGNGADDRIYSGEGNNSVFGGDGNDRIYAGTGENDIYGGDGRDFIFLNEGTAEVSGGGGGDVYVMGTGIYFIESGDLGSLVQAYDARASYFRVDSDVTISWDGEGTATATSDDFAGDHTLVDVFNYNGSNTGSDRVTTNFDASIIKTFGGDDIVFSFGDDVVDLGAGDDLLLVRDGENEFFDGGDGTDTISFSASIDGVRIDLRDDEASEGLAAGLEIANFENVNGSNGGEDLLLGSNSGDVLKGLGGDDRMSARDGNDQMYGGNGEDYFDGGAGRDTMFGGDGVDTFHIDKGEDVDIIADFENNVDRIEIDGMSASFDWRDNATQRSDGVLINLGDGDLILVEDALIGQLNNDIFLV